MTRSLRPPKRHDLRWRRCDLVVLIVLALATGALLGGRAAGRPRAVDPALRGPGQRTDRARERIDLNADSPDSLRRLPRIGPVLTRRIVKARKAGRFKDLDDLQERVKGIAAAIAETIEPLVTFGPGGTVTRAAQTRPTPRTNPHQPI